MNVDVLSSIQIGYRCSASDVNFDVNLDHPYWHRLESDKGTFWTFSGVPLGGFEHPRMKRHKNSLFSADSIRIVSYRIGIVEIYCLYYGKSIKMDVPRELSPVVVLRRLSAEVESIYISPSSARLCPDRRAVVEESRHRKFSSSHDSNSDTDDDLPSIGSMVSCNRNTNRDAKTSRYHDILKEICDRQHTMEKHKESSLKLEEIFSHLKKRDVETNDLDPTEMLLSNGLDMNFCALDSKIADIHPGETVLNFSNSGKIFHKKQLVFTSPEIHKSPIDEWMKGLSPDLLQMEIERGSFLLHFERIYDKKSVIQLLFRLMSVHESYTLAFQCMEALSVVIKKDAELTRCISLKDIIEVFLNYGATLESLIPVPELRSIAEKLVTAETICIKTEERETMNMLPDHCIEFLMSTLKSILLVDENEFESKDHLQILVIILCRIALDSTLQMSAAVIEIQLLIIEILDKFSENLWPQVVVTLAQYLCVLSDMPHNLVAVSRLIFHSERGCHLQRLASYCMIHKLLELDHSLDGLADITPTTALELLPKIINPLKRLNDRSLMYHVITLFDLCVNCDSSQGNWQKFKELAIALKRITGSLKGGVQDVDESKVKDLIARTSMKWQIIANRMPVSQKTLFSYLTTSSGLEQ